MYQTIIFDLDDTLIDEQKNMRGAFIKVLEYKKTEVTKEAIDRFNAIDKKFWRDRAEGKIEEPENFLNLTEKVSWIRAQRFLQYFKGIEIQEAIYLSDLYMESLKEVVVPIEGAKEVITYLFQKGYEIIVATNGPKVPIQRKIEKLGISKYIKDTFCSEEAGYMKPQKEFFYPLLQKINAKDMSKILIVGDDLEKDIKGGNAMGMDTCWFHYKKNGDVSERIPTYQINHLLELKGIL